MSAYRSIAEQIIDPPAPTPRKPSALRAWWSRHWNGPEVVVPLGIVAFVVGLVLAAQHGVEHEAIEQGDALDAKAAKTVCVGRGLEAVKVERIQYGQRRVICLLPDGGTETGVAP